MFFVLFFWAVVNQRSLHAGTVAATYMLLLQHGSEVVVTEASKCLMRELEFLKEKKITFFKDGARSEEPFKREAEVPGSDALLRFDLMLVLYTSVLKEAPDFGVSKAEQAYDFTELILDKLNPFEDPLQWSPHLQLVIWQVLHWPCIYGSPFKTQRLQARGEDFTDRRVNDVKDQGETTEPSHAWKDSIGSAMNRVAGFSLVTALAMDSHASLLVKLEALSWARVYANSNSGARNQHIAHLWNEGYTSQLMTRLPDMLLTMAFDKEPRVRAGVAFVLEAILQSNLVRPLHFQPVTMVALKQLKDPEPSNQALFQRVVQAYAPAALWIYGWAMPFKSRQAFLSNIPQPDRLHMLNGKRTALDLHSSQHLRSQQLSWILNYLSQRTQVLPSNWLQRMMYNFPGKAKSSGVIIEGDEQESTTTDGRMEVFDGLGGTGDSKLLEKLTSNILSALWWTVLEASRHCVTVRLRTHLGGPTQTFAALERMLLDVPHLCRIDFGRREMVMGGLASPTSVQLLPLRLLIEFVEALKKDIYNSYEGSAVLSPPPTLSSLFFRANKKVRSLDMFTLVFASIDESSIASIECV